MSFFLILGIAIIAFALIYYVASEGKMDIFQSLIHVYRLVFGEFGDYDKVLEWIIYFAATILNPLILMNILIAIMGDTYSKIQSTSTAADAIEIA